MPIIDSHCFIGRWVNEKAHSNTRELLDSMKKSGVSRSVVMTTNRGCNGYVRKIVRNHLHSFFFAYWFDPRLPSSLSDLKHLHELGEVALVKVHPSHLRIRLDDERMKPVLDFCSETRLPLLVHCGRWLEMSGYKIALRMAEKFPRLNFFLAHMGGVHRTLRMKTIKEVHERSIGNAYLVTSGPISTKKGVDLLYAPETCPPEIIEFAVDRLGSGHVVFGSDFPFGLQSEILKCIELANVTGWQREDMLWRNARKLLFGGRLEKPSKGL